MENYPATFTDSFGTEETAISNDSSVLRTKLRGVCFSCTDFEFEPDSGTNPELLKAFTLDNNQILTNCKIGLTMPVWIIENQRQVVGTLTVNVGFGVRNPLFEPELSIELNCEIGRFSSPSFHTDFEGALLKIQSQLPAGACLKTCINCLYSDYNPAGTSLFGSLMCFRNIKSEYLKVKSKTDFWGVAERYDRVVQETYVCLEFERRMQGTGYRG